MKMYMTFGQDHVHKINGHTLDKDCVAIINGRDEGDCNRMAREWMDGMFHEHTVNFKAIDMSYYPRGLIEVNPQ